MCVCLQHETEHLHILNPTLLLQSSINIQILHISAHVRSLIALEWYAFLIIASDASLDMPSAMNALLSSSSLSCVEREALRAFSCFK